MGEINLPVDGFLVRINSRSSTYRLAGKVQELVKVHSAVGVLAEGLLLLLSDRLRHDAGCLGKGNEDYSYAPIQLF